MDTTNSSQDKFLYKKDSMLNCLCKLKICTATKDIYNESELSFQTYPPSFNDILSSVVYEDKQYSATFKMYFENCIRIKNVQLFVNDEFISDATISSINLIQDNTVLEFSFSNGRYFLGCFDLTILSIRVIFEDEDDLLLFSKYIKVATCKVKYESLIKMFEEIEATNKHILDACFSKSIKRSGLRNDRDKRNFESTVILLENILSTLKSLYPMFVTVPKTTVTNTHCVVEYSKAAQMDNTGFEWILTNPMNLRLSSLRTNIKISNRYYYPEKVLSTEHVNNYVTYENMLIIGFIKLICSKIINMISIIKCAYDKNTAKDLIITENLPSDYQVPIDIANYQIKLMFSRIIEKLQNLYTGYTTVLNQYKRALKCDGLIISRRPNLTHTFRNIPHYRTVFELIIKWLDYGDYDLSGELYLFRLKKLNKIYEYYCILRILSSLEEIGFGLKSQRRFKYHVGENDGITFTEDQEINNTFELVSTDGSVFLTLYYEPKIFSDLSKNGNGIDELFRVDTYNNFYYPDFLIKLLMKDTNKTAYCIFDAKYQNFDRVREIELSRTCMKYIHGIATKDSVFNKIIYLWLFYPMAHERRKYCLNKCSTNHSKKVFPDLGIFALSPDVSKRSLTEFLEDVIKNMSMFLNQF